MHKYAAFALLIVSALAVPAPESQGLDCMHHDDDVLSCWAIKAATALDRATRSADLKIIEGITFVRDTPIERSGKSLKSEKELLEQLPRDATDRTLDIATMLYESAISFLKSHSLKVDIPEGSMSRALTEGRAKLKKLILPLIAAAGLKIFALVPILLGGLALIVAKALFVGKIALLIAGIIAFQRLFSGGATIGNGFGGNIFNKNPQSTWYDNNQGWNTGANVQGQGYYRSFNDKVDAQNLAYSAQAPSNTNEAN
ncbi:uncharacterized protein LOC131665709 [Phymastichus coffea]|uniref:uncharacterized protein LOC131665709 n=1 Tax=Phymastichus coffea TaxID=108790 RepID=UPI00273C93F1|nr:uncharacterized protein LOC131665709 [Phymastichus coffea]